MVVAALASVLQMGRQTEGCQMESRSREQHQELVFERITADTSELAFGQLYFRINSNE